MAGALDVVIEFVGDASSIQKETAKISGTGSKIKTWAKGVGAAIGAAFAVDQIKDWIGAASKLQDAIGATQQIFGPAAGGVQKFAKSADKNFGISQSAALDAADTFATFGKGAGLTGQNLSGFSTKLVGLAGDLASFRGTSTEQAVEAVGAALRGETEPIRAYGVLLDDATLRQEALRQGLIKSTKQALTPQQKVLAAQAQIFKQTSDAQGDFQRTAGSAANQQKALAAEMENAKASLGTALLPALQAVMPFIEKFTGFIKDNASWLVPLGVALGIVVGAVWAFNAALAANPIVLIALAIAVLIAALILLIKNWDAVWDAIKKGASAVWQFMQDIWDKILGAINAVWQWIKTNWPLLLAIITGPFGLAILWLSKHWSDVVGFFKNIWAWVVKNWPLLLAIITGPFGLAILWLSKHWTDVVGYFAAIWTWLKTAWSTVTDTITAPFTAAFAAISKAIGAIPGWFSDLISGIGRAMSGAAEAIAAPFKWAFNAVAGAWNSTVGQLSFKVPGWVPGLGGKGFSMPKIPTFATGGIMPYTGLALLHQGETVIPAGQASGPAVVINHATFSDPVDVTLLMRRVAFELQTRRV